MTGTGPEPDPSADYQPASEELQHDFRSIITLLSLVTDFNNRGHPILLHDGQLIYRSPLDPKAQPASTISLNALAAIFVRNDVEVTAITPAAYPEMASPADVSDKLNIQVVASEQQWVSTDDDPDDPDFHQLAFTDDVQGFATVTNPLKGDVFFNQTPPKCYCKIIDGGISHLRHFVDEDAGDQFAHNTWRYCLSIDSNDPLVNHIATVADYINTHRQLPEGPRRAQIFHQFSRYLVSQCWPKMHARINHPTSSFFIEQLLRMDERTMRVAFNEHYKSVKDGRRVDKGLAIEIADLASSSGLVDVMKEHPYAASMHLETQTPLPHLTQTFKEVLAATEDAPAPRAYNVETFLEFHDLVIAVIHGYKKALAETKRRRADAQGSSKGSDTDQEDTILHAHWLWSLARLFWRIAQSSMLRQHLEMLNAHNMLQVQLGTVDGKTTSPVQRSPTTVAPGGDDVDDEEAAGDKDDLEEQAVESKAADDGLVSTFQRWMRLQGIYFASLDALSSFSCQLPADVEITFIAMRDPKEARREIDWKATITSLAASSDTAFPLDAQRAIKAIEDRIQSSLLNPDAKQSKVLKAFRAERQRDNDRVTNPTLCRCPVLFSGTCHCEALLSALAKFLLDAIDPTQKDAARLEKLVKDLNNRVIAVSKLCCPVCWKLLEILGYLARGRHPLVTPVSLPPWLPRWVVVKLVDEFGEQLRRELVSMISQPPPIKPPMTHSRNISAGTDVSSSTANSGQSGVYAVHQTWIQKP